MIAAFIISLSLLGVSGLLIDSHRRNWAAARDAAELPERDKRYALAQYRRRMQASSMIGLIGLAIGLWPVVIMSRQAGPLALYTAMLLAACVWIMLLALLDVWATRQHYQRLRTEQLAKQLQLALELASASETSEAEG